MITENEWKQRGHSTYSDCYKGNKTAFLQVFHEKTIVYMYMHIMYMYICIFSFTQSFSYKNLSEGFRCT